MKMPKINKNILLGVGLLVVVIVGYFMFTGKDEVAAPPLVGIQSGSTGQFGQEILIELNRLKALQSVNNNIFKDPAFTSLKDFTQVVVPQPIGRSNPFLPTGN